MRPHGHIYFTKLKLRFSDQKGFRNISDEHFDKELQRRCDFLARVEKSIEIHASPEKINSILKWERFPEWFDSFKKVEWTSKEKEKVGSMVHITSEIAGMKTEYDAEIVEFTKNTLRWRTIGGNFTAISTGTLSPTDSGTDFTISIDYELPYSILGKMIDKLRAHKAMEKDLEKGLKGIKLDAEK
jgi:uncharacterized membrane protein